jgi:hypothetical protein
VIQFSRIIGSHAKKYITKIAGRLHTYVLFSKDRTLQSGNIFPPYFLFDPANGRKWKRSGNKQEKYFRFISSPKRSAKSLGGIVSEIGRDQSQNFHFDICGEQDQCTIKAPREDLRNPLKHVKKVKGRNTISVIS